MKHSTLAYLLLILLTACGSKENEQAAILKGEIKGLGNDTLYLYGADDMYSRMDTLPVTEDKFSATLHPDTLVATWLLLPDGTQHPLFIDKGSRLQLKGSAAEPDFLEITGSAPNEELTRFRQTLKGLGKPSEKVLEQKAQEFINSHPSSLASIYLLEKYFVQKSQPDYHRIKQLIEPMTGELKDRPFIDNLLTLIQEEEKVAVGKSAPYFRLPDRKGKQITRADFKEKYLLIHFWASWDTVSRDSNAIYRRIYRQEEKNKQFAMLGISLDIYKSRWEQAVDNDTLKWDQACNLSGWNGDIIKQFSIRSLPANVLLSPSGRIEGRNISEAALRKKLQEIKEKEEAKKKSKRK